MGNKRRQESVGDNLPHMPEAPRQSILLSSSNDTPMQEAPRSSILLTSSNDSSNQGKRVSYPAITSSPCSQTDATLQGTGSSRCGITAKPSPYAYDDEYEEEVVSGRNSTLVIREMDRLRGMESQKIKRRRKIWAGAANLILLALTTYVLARYIIAYMHLSPSDILLSSSTQNVSPDPLLRTLALLSVSLTAYSALLLLLSAIYLRFSRKRSCSTPTIFVGCMLSILIQIVLSLTNLGIIITWHTYYTKYPANFRSSTRDVARRCDGSWEFDLIWNAANSSPIAEPNENNRQCSASVKTFHLFIMAAVVRVVLFTVFGVLFMYLLRRYNKSLNLGLARIIDDHKRYSHAGTTASHFDTDSLHKNENDYATVKESAEMHQLLEEGHGGGGRRSSRSESLRAGASPLPGQWSTATLSNVGKDAEKDSTLTGAGMPRLSRFGWQRGEPSTVDPGLAIDYHSMSPAEDHDNNGAEGWSAALYRRLWGGSTSEPRHQQVPTTEEQADAQMNANGHMDADGQMFDHDHWYSDHHAESQAEDRSHDRDQSKLGVSGWFGREASGEDDLHTMNAPSRPSTGQGRDRQQHQRTPSQERRANEARHQASKTAGKKFQPPVAERVGDNLPSMPSPTSPSPPSQLLSIRNDPSEGSQQQQQSTQRQHSRRASTDNSLAAPAATPSYVRHLGRMVQRMPSITSGDGQTSSGGSRGPSESSQVMEKVNHYNALSHSQGHGRGYSRSSLGTHSEAFEGSPNVAERPLPGGWH
ncbi:unnamed protein product [Sympodiomycopsis kandeliae]